MTMTMKKRVCVMDASGRLGSALVHRLLHRGYTVHAAFNRTNSPLPPHHHFQEHAAGNYNYGDEKEWEWELGGCTSASSSSSDDEEEIATNSSSSSTSNSSAGSAWKKRLRVFSDVDPLDYHSIMEALHGCSALFYSFELPNSQSLQYTSSDEWMGEMEVRAAHNVLEACAQTDTIHKVVYTSSATAVIWRDQHAVEDEVDERNWSDVNFCKKFKLWHGLWKTVAEKTAWGLAMDRGVNMVSINAGLLMRPELSIKDPYLLGAAEMFKDGVFVTVDLKFLVDAHICVLEDSSSYGRYLCFNRIINCNKDVLNLASKLLPNSSSPHTLEDDDIVYRQRISNNKLRKLMVDFDSDPAQSVAQ